jgi:drug/metabolite transporter (DMT)-like permease
VSLNTLLSLIFATFVYAISPGPGLFAVLATSTRYNTLSAFWFSFLILSIGATTFATTIYFIAIKKIVANSASVFVFLVPFFALIFGVILLQEPLPWYGVFGASISIGVLMFLNNVKLNFNFLKEK